MVNVKTATEIIGELSLMKYFPADKYARSALVRMVCEMAETEDQIQWLVRRTINLFNEWPGPRELRAVFCSKFIPRDGINAYSVEYSDGIPSERAQAAHAIALPPGAVSADLDIDRSIRALAQAKGFSPKKVHVPDIPERKRLAGGDND